MGEAGRAPVYFIFFCIHPAVVATKGRGGVVPAAAAVPHCCMDGEGEGGCRQSGSLHAWMVVPPATGKTWSGDRNGRGQAERRAPVLLDGCATSGDRSDKVNELEVISQGGVEGTLATAAARVYSPSNVLAVTAQLGLYPSLWQQSALSKIVMPLV